MKTISNRLIRKLNPCYDPSEVVKDENEELPVIEWVAKYRSLVHSKDDIVWLLCNKLFMSERDMQLFAVWCAREFLKLVKNPDERSINACNVTERFVNGDATQDELAAAWAAYTPSVAWAAYIPAVAWVVAKDAVERADTKGDAIDAQIDKLLTYFEK